MTTLGGETFSYDAEGNLLQRSGGALGTVQYRWNALGQLDTVKVVGGATTSYGYDAFGQRVRKTVNGVTTRYVLHDGQVAMELTSNGGIVAEYTYYPGTDRPHGMRRGGVQYFYVQDAQGNVIGLLNASGAVVEGYAYTPEGALIAGGNSVTNPYRFKGREWDAEAGLYYMRARYYDPATGRFVSEDPIGLEGGINPYLFGAADPVNYSDPWGLAPCSEAALNDGWYSFQAENGNWWCFQPYRLPTMTIGGDGSWYYGGSPTRRGPCGLCGAGGEAVFRGLSQLSGPLQHELLMFLPNNAVGAVTGLGAGALISGVARRLGVSAVARGGAAAVRAGQAGESAVRGVASLGPKVPIDVAGRVRIPDGLRARFKRYRGIVHEA